MTPYEKKSQDLIRKECSLREIKLHTRTFKADCIKCLRRYDDLVNRGERASEASMLANGSTRRTKHCVFRLINVLMFQDLVTRLIEVTEVSTVKIWMMFKLLKEINDEDCKGLIHDDVSFEGINPAVVVPHTAEKLEEMWSELRPNALSNVRGGLYVEDEFDTLEPSSPTPTRESPNSSNPTMRGTNNKRVGPSTPQKNNQTKRVKTEVESMDILLVLVGCITAAREAEVMQAMEPDHEAAARTRAEHHKMLDDIRKRINDIQSEMTSASSPLKLRLQEDLEFYLEERTRIMEYVRSQEL
ncbi:hypothetical protein PHMEG_00013680 [Phytophthora megakarya]|uniref:Uncharacterized protein n=1 Tax=Phytophthora megakarya TaxID=4795 RepID=A0A225W663_9STRA|nr:hypothetical protein PHMEG_00013680 [Phytophthora megakarya]